MNIFTFPCAPATFLLLLICQYRERRAQARLRADHGLVHLAERHARLSTRSESGPSVLIASRRSAIACGPRSANTGFSAARPAAEIRKLLLPDDKRSTVAA